LLHFNLVDFPVNFIKHFFSSFCWYYCFHINKNIAYHITEVLISYADKLVVMGSSKNLRVIYIAILLKSRKFGACEIYVFYSMMKGKERKEVYLHSAILLSMTYPNFNCIALEMLRCNIFHTIYLQTPIFT